jgi:transposase
MPSSSIIAVAIKCGSGQKAVVGSSYHPAMLLKLYVRGYLNRIQSSRRLERECRRNVELMWLTWRLAPDHKAIADFRRRNGAETCAACAQFIGKSYIDL